MDTQLNKPLILAIALLQGIALTALYQSVEHQIWPGNQPVWLVFLATFFIAFPLLTLMSIKRGNGLKIVKFLLPFCLLLAAIGGYVGWQQEPAELVDNGSVIGIFCATALLASFKALMYLQQYMSGQTVTYSSLFKLSWQNFIIFCECWLFVLIFWGILHLGAGLFAVLEIELFKTLLGKDWFVIPTLNLAFGFAVIVFRNIIQTVDHISTILQTLFKFLLPALTIVSLGFLVTLPFVGLSTLWDTGKGSALVMCLQALTLFFVNAVYQEASHIRPYRAFLHRLIFIGVAVLPIYSLISLYGLSIRVNQYGLSVDRCWALLVWALLACFSVGYLYGIIKQRDAWLNTLSTVNVHCGKIVLLLMLLVNTPVLNFQSFSVQSQMARLHEGQVNYNNFDYSYFERSLGRQGYLAMQELKQTLAVEAPEKVVVIDRMYINNKTNAKKDPHSLVDFRQYITIWPATAEIPDSLIKAVYKTQTNHSWATYRDKNYYFIVQDLNKDGNDDFILLTERNNHTGAAHWFLKGEKWKSRYLQMQNPDKITYLKHMLQEDGIKLSRPIWDDISIGSIKIKMN